MSHIDPSCDKCQFPGPLRIRFGTTMTTAASWPVRTHFATRCPNCMETVVLQVSAGSESPMTEVVSLYEPPRFDRVPGNVAAACMTPLFDTDEVETTRKDLP